MGGDGMIVRFVAGAASALLFAGAGIFWWQSRAHSDEGVIAAAPPPSAVALDALPVAAPGLTGAPPPMPPSATPQTREEKRFARYDRNRDGVITRTELMSSRTKAFKKLDTDGNNLLSFEEWAVKTSDRFAEADGDGNGKLTPSEFATTAPKRSAKPKCEC
jgi:hypothetical protein